MTKFIQHMRQVATPWFAALPFLLFTALPAQSTPLVWTLNNAVFNDGGQATGSFVYDDDTHTVSYANITTTAGSIVQFDTPYNASLVNSRSTTSHLVFWDGFFTSDYSYTEWYELNLPLTQPMTNDGGEIPLALGQQSYDEAFVFGLHLIPPAYCDLCLDRAFVSGSIIAQPVSFDDANARTFAHTQAFASANDASTAPEPSTLALLSVALCGLGLWDRNRQTRPATWLTSAQSREEETRPASGC